MDVNNTLGENINDSLRNDASIGNKEGGIGFELDELVEYICGFIGGKNRDIMGRGDLGDLKGPLIT